jgi:hypothetical protein
MRESFLGHHFTFSKSRRSQLTMPDMLSQRTLFHSAATRPPSLFRSRKHRESRHHHAYNGQDLSRTPGALQAYSYFDVYVMM